MSNLVRSRLKFCSQAIGLLASVIMLNTWAHAADSGLDLSFSTKCQSSDDVVVISLIGDILVHEAIYRYVVEGPKDFSKVWRKVEPLFAKADFSIANLEGPAAMGIDGKGRDHGDIGFVYDKVVYSGTDFRFNYHPQILHDMKKSGLDLITVANNHTLDRKSIGVDRTIEAAEQIDLPTVGIRHSQDRNGTYSRVMKVGDLSVGVIGCTEMTNGQPDPKSQVLHCYKQASEVERLIGELRNKTDAVIVYPHWGAEYQHTPNSAQKKYARQFLEAGATAIVGAHPHVLQPWEKYVTRDGRETLIAYSLGNFVAYQARTPKKTGAVLYIALSQAAASKGKVVSALYTPTYRDGFTVYPVGDSAHRDAREEAIRHFGEKNRVLPTERIEPRICP